MPVAAQAFCSVSKAFERKAGEVFFSCLIVSLQKNQSRFMNLSFYVLLLKIVISK